MLCNQLWQMPSISTSTGTPISATPENWSSSIKSMKWGLTSGTPQTTFSASRRVGSFTMMSEAKWWCTLSVTRRNMTSLSSPSNGGYQNLERFLGSRGSPYLWPHHSRALPQYSDTGGPLHPHGRTRIHLRDLAYRYHWSGQAIENDRGNGHRRHRRSHGGGAQTFP